MKLGILALWAQLQVQGWYISFRTGCYFMHKPDGTIAYHAPDRDTLLNRLPEQFA